MTNGQICYHENNLWSDEMENGIFISTEDIFSWPLLLILWKCPQPQERIQEVELSVKYSKKFNSFENFNYKAAQQVSFCGKIKCTLNMKDPVYLFGLLSSLMAVVIDWWRGQDQITIFSPSQIVTCLIGWGVCSSNITISFFWGGVWKEIAKKNT